MLTERTLDLVPRPTRTTREIPQRRQVRHRTCPRSRPSRLQQGPREGSDPRSPTHHPREILQQGGRAENQRIWRYHPACRLSDLLLIANCIECLALKAALKRYEELGDIERYHTSSAWWLRDALQSYIDTMQPSLNKPSDVLIGGWGRAVLRFRHCDTSTP